MTDKVGVRKEEKEEKPNSAMLSYTHTPHIQADLFSKVSFYPCVHRTSILLIMPDAIREA